MNISKLALITFICFAFTVVAVAQPPHERSKQSREEIESMRIAFITKRLNLTPEDSQKFWPVYNQNEKELRELRMSHRKSVKKLRSEAEELSDQELEKLVDGEVAFRQNELDVMKKYHQQYKEVISVRQMAALYKANQDFKRELLRKLKHKENGERQQRSK